MKEQTLEEAFNSYCPVCNQSCFDCVCGNNCDECKPIKRKVIKIRIKKE